MMPKIELFISNTFGNMPVAELISNAKTISFEEDVNELNLGDECYMMVDKFGKDEYSLAEWCVTTIRKKIGDSGCFRLIVSKQAFKELTPVQKNVFFKNCTKYLVFVKAIGKYSIYMVCEDSECENHTYAIYHGTTLVEKFVKLDDALDFAELLRDGEKSGKTIDDTVKEVAQPKFTPKFGK